MLLIFYLALRGLMATATKMVTPVVNKESVWQMVTSQFIVSLSLSLSLSLSHSSSPPGNHDGMVKGKRYFRCKPKCGVFVKNDKIIKRPSLGGGGSTSCATGPRRLSGQPPMSSTSPSRTSCPTSTAGLATGPSTPRKKSLSAGKEPSYLRSTASSARRSVKRNS